MIYLVFPMGKALQLSLCAKLCFVGISYILEHTFWYLYWFLATNSFFWLTQVSFIVLNVLCLLDHNFLIKLTFVSFCCLEHKFFLQYKLFYCLLMPVHHSFSVLSRLLVLSSGFFEFCSIMWFLLPLGFSWWLLLLFLSWPFSFIIHP